MPRTSPIVCLLLGQDDTKNRWRAVRVALTSPRTNSSPFCRVCDAPQSVRNGRSEVRLWRPICSGKLDGHPFERTVKRPLYVDVSSRLSAERQVHNMSRTADLSHRHTRLPRILPTPRQSASFEPSDSFVWHASAISGPLG